MTKRPTTFVAVRDGVCLALGVLGVGFQQVTGEVSLPLLGVYMTLLGIPGLSNGLWLLKQIGGQPLSPPASGPSSGQPQSESEQ